MPIGVNSIQPGSPSPGLCVGVDDCDAVVAIDLRGELDGVALGPATRSAVYDAKDGATSPLLLGGASCLLPRALRRALVLGALTGLVALKRSGPDAADS